MFLSAVSTTPLTASATTYTGWHSRGMKNLSYCKTSATWEVNSKYAIEDSETWQYANGLFAQAGGTWRFEANSMEHGWSTIAEQLIGIEVSGVNFGYTISYQDDVYLTNSGSYYVEWNV